MNNINNLENDEKNMILAEQIFKRMKFYCQFKGLDFFTSSDYNCISDLASIL